MRPENHNEYTLLQPIGHKPWQRIKFIVPSSWIGSRMRVTVEVHMTKGRVKETVLSVNAARIYWNKMIQKGWSAGTQ
jgi:hypothetical protein